jgi:alpha-methylacyl-CoA racemase
LSIDPGATGGPLRGIRVVELGGIGPGPHAAMLLADLGADVVRVDRPSGGLAIVPPGERDWQLRGRRLVTADLKTDEGRAAMWGLLEVADVLIEGFRPGVTERMGIGPEVVHARNPRLVYARMTGWGQHGPLAPRAGHDINYISVTGGLNAMRVRDAAGTLSRPVPPLNMFGDFGGGSVFLVMGVLAALLERERSGLGQVVDAGIVDGASALLQVIWGMRAVGEWSDTPASNVIDTGTPFYDTYACADGNYVAVGSLEPQFYAALLAGLGLAAEDLPAQYDRAGWPALRARFTALFATRTRDEWATHFDGSDACVTPVLSFAEAADHPHLRDRGTLIEIDGITQAAPAPRFSRTAPALPSPPATEPTPVAEVLVSWGAGA